MMVSTRHVIILLSSKGAAVKHFNILRSVLTSLVIFLFVAESFAQTTSPATADSAAVRVVTGFECSSRLTFETPEPDHVVVTLDDNTSIDGWMFRLEGVAGKTVRIDVTSKQKIAKWITLNPVYAPGTDLNDPALYVAGPSVGQSVTARKVKVPDTAGQKWHYITNAKLTKNVFTMTQTFDTDAVWIANRVPYTPKYNEQFMDSLAKNPLVKVIEIGKLTSGRRLLMAQIGGDDAAAKSKPCVLIAGGEQAIQPDGMWSAQGAIEYLSSDNDVAKKLRDHCRFLIIPMLDPDGVANADQELVNQFRPRTQSDSAIAYANFFQQWVLAGNRLDVVFETHSIQSHEYPHLSRAFIEVDPARGPIAEALNDAVVSKFKAADLVYSPKVQTKTLPVSRFGGWLAANYGPIFICYEVNSQDPTRHLDLMQLKATGGIFAQVAGEYLAATTGTELLAAVDTVRTQHQTNWNNNPATQPSQNAIESEAAVRPTVAPNQTFQAQPGGL
jgi:Zinc carboxypeptidase